MNSAYLQDVKSQSIDMREGTKETVDKSVEIMRTLATYYASCSIRYLLILVTEQTYSNRSNKYQLYINSFQSNFKKE